MEETGTGTKNTHQLEHQNKPNQKQQVSGNNDREMTSNTETINTIAMGLNGLTSIVLIFITSFISYLAVANGVVLFSFHPIFMGFGVSKLSSLYQNNLFSHDFFCSISYLCSKRYYQCPI